MKNKFNIPVKYTGPNYNHLINCIDKFTTYRGDLDYTRNIVQNFRMIYFGIRLKIKRK